MNARWIETPADEEDRHSWIPFLEVPPKGKTLVQVPDMPPPGDPALGWDPASWLRETLGPRVHILPASADERFIARVGCEELHFHVATHHAWRLRDAFLEQFGEVLIYEGWKASRKCFEACWNAQHRSEKKCSCACHGFNHASGRAWGKELADGRSVAWETGWSYTHLTLEK